MKDVSILVTRVCLTNFSKKKTTRGWLWLYINRKDVCNGCVIVWLSNTGENIPSINRINNSGEVLKMKLGLMDRMVSFDV